MIKSKLNLDEQAFPDIRMGQRWKDQVCVLRFQKVEDQGWQRLGQNTFWGGMGGGAMQTGCMDGNIQAKAVAWEREGTEHA